MYKFVKVNDFFSIQGMKRFDAREKVAQMLQKNDLWRGQTPHSMAVPVCSRSSDIIEPRLKEQWFIDISTMADQALQVRLPNVAVLCVTTVVWTASAFRGSFGEIFAISTSAKGFFLRFQSLWNSKSSVFWVRLF